MLLRLLDRASRRRLFANTVTQGRGSCPTWRPASRDADAGRYQHHRPEQTLLYRIVDEYYPAFTTYLTEQGRELLGYVQREFEDYLKCGRLEHGFLRVRCESCHAEHLVAFSCKRRGFCPSCGALRMAESAALLVDEVLPEQPMRQWVLSFPYRRGARCSPCKPCRPVTSCLMMG